MKIRLLCIGGIRERAVANVISDYSARITHYWPFSITEIPDLKVSKTIDTAARKALEGERFMAEIVPADYVVLFDERGTEMSSRKFSQFITDKAARLPRNLVFLIGGAYGFSDKVYERADSMISLSQMTFPHELVRLFIVEQIYRAGTISRGEPYHHD